MTFTLNGSLYKTLVELSAATPSEGCRQWLHENGLGTPSIASRATRVANLQTKRNTLDALGHPKKRLDDRNYLNDQNHGALVLFLADQLPAVIDPLGYEGWDLFFQMLPSWKGYLDELPGVITSLLAGK